MTRQRWSSARNIWRSPMLDDLGFPDQDEVAHDRAAFVDQVMKKYYAWREAEGLDAKKDLLAEVDSITPETFKHRDYGADPYLADRLGIFGPMRRVPPPMRRTATADELVDMAHFTDALPDFSTDT